MLPFTLLISILAAGGCAESGRLSGREPAKVAPAAPPVAALPGHHIALGRKLLEMGEPDLAYKAFMNAIRTDGISSEALIGAGLATEQQGLLTASRRHFERALEIDPDSVEAHNNLGVVLFHLKEYHAARDAFRAAFALSSGRSGIAERNLNRAEGVVARIEAAGQPDPAISHRVVRLGTSEFRITPSAATPAEMMKAE